MVKRVASEKQVVLSILHYLKNLPKCHAIKLHGDIYLPVGTPDIICVRDGVPFFIEAKKIGGRLSLMQQVQMDRWLEAGAVVGVATSVEEAKDIVDDPA